MKLQSGLFTPSKTPPAFERGNSLRCMRGVCKWSYPLYVYVWMGCSDPTCSCNPFDNGCVYCPRVEGNTDASEVIIVRRVRMIIANVCVCAQCGIMSTVDCRRCPLFRCLTLRSIRFLCVVRECKFPRNLLHFFQSSFTWHTSHHVSNTLYFHHSPITSSLPSSPHK